MRCTFRTFRWVSFGLGVAWRSALRYWVGEGRAPAYAVRRLSDLGPFAIKVAQVAATRADLFTPIWRMSLAQLHQQVPYVAESITVPDVSSVGLVVDRDPVAVGSIASVHRGRTSHGEVVAVKIIRKDVRAEIAEDAEMCRTLIPLVQLALRNVPVSAILTPLLSAAERQTSMTEEGRSLDTLHQLFAGDDRVIVPRPLMNLSSDSTLVMAYVEEADGIDHTSEVEGAAKVMLEAVFKMIFWGGVVHCDLHPGNLFVTASQHVVILDAGFTVGLSAASRRLLADFFIGLALGRWEDCATAVVNALITTDRVDLARFRDEVARIAEANDLRKSPDFSVARLATELFAVQKRFGAFTHREFVFPLLSLLTVEGRVREASSTLSIASVAVPIIVDARSLTGMAGVK